MKRHLHTRYVDNSPAAARARLQYSEEDRRALGDLFSSARRAKTVHSNTDRARKIRDHWARPPVAGVASATGTRAFTQINAALSQGVGVLTNAGRALSSAGVVLTATLVAIVAASITTGDNDAQQAALPGDTGGPGTAPADVLLSDIGVAPNNGEDAAVGRNQQPTVGVEPPAQKRVANDNAHNLGSSSSLAQPIQTGEQNDPTQQAESPATGNGGAGIDAPVDGIRVADLFPDLGQFVFVAPVAEVPPADPAPVDPPPPPPVNHPITAVTLSQSNIYLGGRGDLADVSVVQEDVGETYVYSLQGADAFNFAVDVNGNLSVVNSFFTEPQDVDLVVVSSAGDNFVFDLGDALVYLETTTIPQQVITPALSLQFDFTGSATYFAAANSLTFNRGGQPAGGTALVTFEASHGNEYTVTFGFQRNGTNVGAITERVDIYDHDTGVLLATSSHRLLTPNWTQPMTFVADGAFDILITDISTGNINQSDLYLRNIGVVQNTYDFAF